MSADILLFPACDEDDEQAARPQHELDEVCHLSPDPPEFAVTFTDERGHRGSLLSCRSCLEDVEVVACGEAGNRDPCIEIVPLKQVARP